MKIEGTGEVEVQVANETPTVDAANTEAPTEAPKEEVTLPSDEGEQLIAGKFKTQEDLLNAYKELESKLGQPKEEVPTEAPTEEPKIDEEYEAYKTKKAQDELLKDLGGVDKYTEAVNWASNNLSEAEVAEYNEALEAAGDNPTIVKQLAKALIEKASSTNTTPTIDTIHGGETARVEQTKGYTTKSDMMADMRDPRYEKDEGFRQAVAKKLAVTNESKWYGA